MHAGAGRIHHHHIRVTVRFKKIVVEQSGHIACKKFGVMNVVLFSISAGIVHSGLDIFNADNARCLLGQKQSDASGPGVQIVNQFLSAQPAPFPDQAQHGFGLLGVGLKKRRGRDPKGQAIPNLYHPVLTFVDTDF